MLADNRPRARGMFFGKAKQIAPFLDATAPLATGAGIMARKIAAEADGQPIPAEYAERQIGLNQQWGVISGFGLTDEEWVRLSAVASEHLDSLDDGLAKLALRRSELDKKVPPNMKADNETFNTLPDSDKLVLLRRHVIEAMGLSPAAAERFDAQICTTALRFHLADKGARMPKKNDGVDFTLAMHVAEDCILVSADDQFIAIADQSGTYQAPWIRRMNDLDDLPEGPPWGESAREEARRFKRRPK
jgi:hypothetical protein